MIALFDTHAHLLDERFCEDREAVLTALAENGIAHVMEACCEEAQIDEIVRFVSEHPMLYGSAGVHPHSADTFTPDTLTHMERALSHERIVAIGEIGLDYHYDFSPRSVQRDCFDAQLALAGKCKVPVIIHDREAHGDCMDLLHAHRTEVCGVMHCFSGSYEIAKRCIDYGLYVAFGGALTFKNAVHQQDIAKRLPPDRILIETDCPYMTPVPHRGKRNDPTLLRLTFELLCELRGMDRETLGEQLMKNSFDAFHIAY